MPITQARLAHVVRTARDIETIYLTTCQQIARLMAKLRSGQVRSGEFLAQLEQLVLAPEQTIALQSALLTNEELHYKYTHKKNAYDMERRRRRNASPEALPESAQNEPYAGLNRPNFDSIPKPLNRAQIAQLELTDADDELLQISHAIGQTVGPLVVAQPQSLDQRTKQAIDEEITRLFGGD